MTDQYNSYTKAQILAFLELQSKSKNPIRLMPNHVEILCRNKSAEVWCKIDFADLESVSSLRWKVDIHTQKYWTVTSSSDGTTTLLSRFLLKADNGQFVDHKNGDPTDNRRDNLRFCTLSQNSQNRMSLKGRKWKGIYYCNTRNAWVAQISVKGKTKNIGRFPSARMAAEAYNEKAKIYHGEFARLNEL